MKYFLHLPLPFFFFFFCNIKWKEIKKWRVMCYFRIQPLGFDNTCMLKQYIFLLSSPADPIIISLDVKQMLCLLFVMVEWSIKHEVKCFMKYFLSLQVNPRKRGTPLALQRTGAQPCRRGTFQVCTALSTVFWVCLISYPLYPRCLKQYHKNILRKAKRKRKVNPLHLHIWYEY